MKKITLLLMMTLAFVNMAKADVEWTLWEGSESFDTSTGGVTNIGSYCRSIQVGDVLTFTVNLGEYAYHQKTLDVKSEAGGWATTTIANYVDFTDAEISACAYTQEVNEKMYKEIVTNSGMFEVGGKGYTLTKVTAKRSLATCIKTTLANLTASDNFDGSKLNNAVAGDYLYVEATVSTGNTYGEYILSGNEVSTLTYKVYDKLLLTLTDAQLTAWKTTWPWSTLTNLSEANIYLIHPVSSFSIGSIGYATFSAAQQVTAPASVTAYKGEKISGDKLVLTPFTNNVIPANTGAIIAGTQGAVLEFTASSAETSETSETSPLHANTAETSVSSLADEGYDLYVLYPGKAESETDLSLSTLLGNWGSSPGNIATWTSGTNTITFATKSTIYDTSTDMGDWTTIDENTLTKSLFSSIVVGDKIVVTASESYGGQVWLAKLEGNSWSEVNLINGADITTSVSYTLTAEDIDIIKERGIRLKGKNFTLATVEIERASGDGEGGTVSADWSTYDKLKLSFSANSLDADATFYVAYTDQDDEARSQATLTQGYTSVEIELNGSYKNDIESFSMWSTATSGSLTFESAALIDNDGATVAEFRKTTSGTLASNKAYLKIPAGELARALSIVFDDEQETTAIESVAPKAVAKDNIYYDLQGRRVAQPTKGLYIVNGKKVFIK